ncbi:MAG: RNA polymerase factor sigma-54 [Alphaproteobacteria bacterium]|nr:RNA polymerase factor sigma-54 [Alphaproteobacteria bacterium]MCB9975315.1 RNA polymerase factor sigma-54 [Rhodospirillales bacterium]
MSTLSQKLDLRQSQQLVMTPQLQQAIKLLQLNNLELDEFLEEELEKNPLLERAEEPAESNDSADTDAGDASPSDDGSSESEAYAESGFEEEGDAAWNYDPGAGLSMAGAGAGGNTKFEDPDSRFEDRMSARKSLREHLLEQLHVTFGDNRDRMIGALLIDLIDESGYLREGYESLAGRLGCSIERIERLLRAMKQFDPTGVFAADLRECLALQLEEQGKLDAPMCRLLDHLDLLAKHDLGALCKLCEVNPAYLQDMIEEIRGQNPRPASDFDHLVVQTALPDVFMRRLPKHVGGGWRVELNSETLPRVLVNQAYFTQVSHGAGAKKDKDYLNSQLASANWLVRALDQRAQTILKVAGVIVEEQDAFFNYGIEFLRPLTLRDVAEKIDMHESTVSRVTTNKYISTPRGLLELKYFFTTALTSEDGSVHSAESVKARIKSLIDMEKPDSVLSDDAIVTLLKGEGIDLARRTVAKYREGMGIGSSVARRRQKKAFGRNQL